MPSDQDKSIQEAYRGWASDFEEMRRFTFHRVAGAIDWEILTGILPGKPCEVLDAGGGDGYWTVRIAELGHRVTLIDLSYDMLEIAKARVAKAHLAEQIEIRPGNVCRVDFGDESFDFVLARGGVLSHCLDFEGAFVELFRTMRPGARIFAAVDNFFVQLCSFVRRRKLRHLDEFLKTGNTSHYLSMELPYQTHFTTVEELATVFRTHGIELEQMLGRPILVRHDAKDTDVSDDRIARLVELERRYIADPHYLRAGAQLVVVGRKP